MIFSLRKNVVRCMRILSMGGAAILAACTSVPVDDTTNSQLVQPGGATPPGVIEAGDIAIAGQDFSHSVRDLPEVSGASKPPLVQFAGVTSIIDGPVDTEAYTALLRDRLLLGAREKLRFVEQQLPPLLTKPKKIKSRKELPPPVVVTRSSNSVMTDNDPDYQVKAELRGKFSDDLYFVQIQFVDFHTGNVLFNGLYHIRKEVPGVAPTEDAASPPAGATAPDTSNMSVPTDPTIQDPANGRPAASPTQ